MDQDKQPEMPITEAIKGLFPIIYWAAVIYIMIFQPGVTHYIGFTVGIIALLSYILFIPAHIALLILIGSCLYSLLF